MRQIDPETLFPIKDGANLRFFHNRSPVKPLVNVNFDVKIKVPHFEKFTRSARSEYRKTKTRVFLPYQVCLDDIPDEVMYKDGGLVSYIYSSDWKDAINQAAAEVETPPKVRLNRFEPADPVRMTKKDPIPPPMPTNGLSKIQKWEREQLRPDFNFHEIENQKRKPKNPRPSTKQTNRLEIDPWIKDLVQKNRLRTAYDRAIPGYTGFQPQFAPQKLDLEKNMFLRIDPYVTNYDLLTGNYRNI